jgi:hypothetical protein
MKRTSLYAVKVEEMSAAADYAPERAVLHIVCDQGMRANPNLVIFGVGGDIRDADRTPLMILKDGHGDYGSYCEGPSRHFQTNIRDKVIKPREMFTVHWQDEDRPHRQMASTFRIMEVHALT